ncbi:Uncharacterised protein [Mycobacteroides abscessus]|nr:Uncharacterised protein [Mycobacteroides abscessus]
MSAVTHSAYPGRSRSCTPAAYSSLMRCADVEPVTEQRFLPSSDSGPVMSVLSSATSRSCPATKYGPANATVSLRVSVMEYVAKIMSTCPVCSIVSRCADGASTHSIWSSEKPSSPAT